MNMDLRRLRYFVAVAQELHFGRAAAKLHIAQPSLSQQIRTLERELGVELLRRDGRRVALTPAGDALLREGRRALDQARRAVEAARSAGSGESGLLRVGFMGSAGRELMPRVIREFRERHPDVSVEVREIALSETNRALLEGLVDVAFVRPIESEPELVVENLPGDGLLAVVPEHHPLAERSSLPLRALAEERFIRPNATAGLQPWISFLSLICDRHGFAPRYAEAEGSSLQSIVGLVAAGAGVSVMSRTTHTLPRDGVAAVPVEDEEMPLALSRRADNRAPAVERFAALVHEYAGAAAP